MSMFNINKDTNTASNQSFFHGGINFPVTLQSVAREGAKKDGTGTLTTVFTFDNPTGAEYKLRFWDINEESIRSEAMSNPKTHNFSNAKLGFTKGSPITPDDAVKQAVADYQNNIFQILNVYLPEDKINLSANNYDELVASINKSLGNVHKGVQVALLLVYGSKGYLEKPRYGRFIAKTAEELQANFEKNKEKTVKPAETAAPAHPADELGDALAKGPASEATTSAQVDDDLPF